MAIAAYILLTFASSGAIGAAQGTPSQKAVQKAEVEAERAAEAEALLQDLRRRRSDKDVIPPASAAGRTVQRSGPKLLPEGTAVVAQSGTIAQSGSWWVFAAIGIADAQPFKLLPNSTLEAMVRMHRTALEPLAFTVSGELTVFSGENYLLARSAARAISSSAAGSMPGENEQPASMRPVGPETDSDAVLEAMRQLTPQMPVVVGPQATGQVPSGRFSAPAPLMEGVSLAARSGRLVRTGDGWAFTFDTDRPEEAEAPLRVMPSLSLEFMTRARPGDASGLRFMVSGEITEFEGQNYLLIRAATRPLETGNLRR